MLAAATRTVVIALVALAPFALLTACAGRPPVALSTAFDPPSDTTWPAGKRMRAGTYLAGSCHVRLAGIVDLRTDPHTMGDIGGRMVHAADTVAWLRSGLAALNRDPRIAFIDSAEAGPGLAMNIDLIKAYVLSITDQKSANIVLRVRYSKGDAPLDEPVYRGVDTGTNWASGIDETQGAFDRALAQLISALDRDIVARC